METILILEDIENVRAVFASVLRREGYSVLEAITIDEALDHQKKHAGQPIPLVIANVILPGRASGTQAALELRKEQPDLKILFTSGTPMDAWTQSDFQNVAALPAGSYSFIAKPFVAGVLKQKVRELLDSGK
jgi:two-component system cell cycle response regulator CpdR